MKCAIDRLSGQVHLLAALSWLVGSRATNPVITTRMQRQRGALPEDGIIAMASLNYTGFTTSAGKSNNAIDEAMNAFWGG